MSPLPRLLVVQHEDKAPIGLVGRWLARSGLECDVLPAHEGRALPASLGDHVGLVVLGGSMGAEDDLDHRWLLPTKALIAGTVAAGVPFLGICLGHQLATVALGGTVGPHPSGQTMGLRAWLPTEDGRTDDLTRVLPAGSEVFHWNNDVALTLPPGARLLASSADGTVQAVRFGPQAWGVQFHPEVDADLVMGWALGAAPEAELAAIRSLRGRQGDLHRTWELLLRRFAQVVLQPTSEPA